MLTNMSNGGVGGKVPFDRYVGFGRGLEDEYKSVVLTTKVTKEHEAKTLN